MIRTNKTKVALIAVPALCVLAAASGIAVAHPQVPVQPAGVYSTVHVTGARIVPSRGYPGGIRIVAKGMVNSTGWHSPRLKYVPGSARRSGVMTYRFIAERPHGRVFWKYQKVRAVKKLHRVPPRARAIRILGRNGSLCVSLRTGHTTQNCKRFFVYKPKRYSLVQLTGARIKPLLNQPGAIKIVARGRVNSTGWRGARLQRVYNRAGNGKVITYRFVAKRPQGIVGWAFQNVRATRKLHTVPHRVRAIRIVGQGRTICIPMRPGAGRKYCRGYRGIYTKAAPAYRGLVKVRHQDRGPAISF